MNFLNLRRSSTFLLLLFVFSVNQSSAQHEKALPPNTAAAFSILDLSEWNKGWKTTSIAQYLSNPGVAEAFESWRQQAGPSSFWLSFLNPESMESFADGQLTLAAIEAGSSLEFILLVDIEDVSKTLDWVQSVRKECEADGGISKEKKLSSATMLVIDWQDNSLSFLVQDKLLVVSTQASLVEVAANKPTASLLESIEFRSTVGKSQSEVNDPGFWWFVNPVAVWSLNEAVASPESFANNQKLMEAEGFQAVRAAGGYGQLFTDSKTKLTSVGMVLADLPFQRGARLLTMENKPTPNVPDWLNGSVSAGAVNLKLDPLLENYSTIFDTQYGEGEEGIFDLVLEDLKNDPQGPRVDLQKEIVDQLQAPVFFASKSSDQSSAILFGATVVNEQTLTSAMTRFYSGDSNAQKLAEKKYAAWSISPLDEMEVGIREPYVVVIRDGYFMVAPTIELIEIAFNSKSDSSIQFASEEAKRQLGEMTCLHYVVQMQALAEMKHAQLALGKVDGLLGQIISQLKLEDSLTATDRSKLPEFAEVKNYFDSNLQMTGKMTESGWKLWIEVGSLSNN